MVILENTVIIIDPNKEEAEKIRKMLRISMKNVAIINIKCLYPRFKEINGLMNQRAYLKMFYGGSEKSFNKMLLDFDLKDDRNSIYIGWKLKISKIVISYWKHYLNKTFSMATLGDGGKYDNRNGIAR